MSERFTSESIATWRREGAVLLPSFFGVGEMQAVVRDFAKLFAKARPTTGSAVSLKRTERMEDLPRKQFELIRSMPFACSTALNLLALHPALIAFARVALDSPDVRLYQNIAWAKYTGATDFDQPFHMDYSNHTLLVPGDLPGEKTLNMSIYATDVANAHGAIHYVPRPEGDEICGALRPPNPDSRQQKALRKIERPGIGPIGSIFAYSTDVYHRATNLTAENGHRYTVFAGYKAARNSSVIGNPWPSAVPHLEGDELWNPIFGQATPEQLSCLDIPPPGHPFWTSSTLVRTQARWPSWNLGPWREALPTV